MIVTLDLDDKLVETAREFTGVSDDCALLRLALRTLVEREASQRLAALEGTMPELQNVPRRRVG